MSSNWLQAEWPAPAFIKAGISLRQGGVSKAPYDSLNIATHVGDDVDAVEQNRNMLVLPNMPQWLEQIHSTQAVLLPCDITTPKADASYTVEREVVCAVMTADCLPLLITDTKGSCVAAIHAGWRGLCDGIIETTIETLPAKNEELLVWLGPAIGANVYEIGVEVYDAFTKNDAEAKQAFTSTSAQHWLFDIYCLAKQRLQRIGVRQIFGGDHCTLSEKEHFFSYRRDNITGRMASMIWIEK